MNIIAQIIGFIGVGTNAIVYQQKSHKKVLVYKAISDIIWGVHYILLGATMGAVVSGVALCREGVFLNSDKKWAKTKLWLVLFMAISITASSLKFSTEGLKAFLPMAASVMSVISFWQPSPKISRILVFPISVCMITYAAFSGSYAGMLNETITIVSSVIGIVRNDVKFKPHELHSKEQKKETAKQ